MSRDRRPRVREAKEKVDDTPAGPMRVQRFLARAGVASRRRAEDLVAEGRVTINGQLAQTGQSVDPAKDQVAVDGQRISAPRGATWLVLHKPPGVITSRGDERGRQTVFDLVKDVPGLVYVGRLDYMTEGVLLLTTDGEAANRLTHPSAEVERTYVATVRGPAARAVRAATRGVQLEDGWMQAVEADATPLGSGRWDFTVTIAEGRNREVRRFCEAVGLTVERLVRTQFGPVRLGGLEPGESRPPSATERRLLAAIGKEGLGTRD